MVAYKNNQIISNQSSSLWLREGVREEVREGVWEGVREGSGRG